MRFGVKRILCLLLAPLFLFAQLPIALAREDKVIALTFDDGPNATYTPQVLDLLAAYNAKATFFVLGSNIDKNEGLLQRMVAEGHDVGNHTYGHSDLSKISAANMASEIQKGAERIHEACGIYPALVRPPYGHMNSTVKSYCKEQNLSITLWDIDTRDWENSDYAAVAKKTIAAAKSGDIILFHDRKASTVRAVELVLEALSAEGYRFVTVSELLGLEKSAASAPGAPSASFPSAPGAVPQYDDTLVYIPVRRGITTGKVNFRAAPSTDAEKILKYGQLSRNTAVKVIGKCGDWYHVLYGGVLGYIYEKYLKLV